MLEFVRRYQKNYWSQNGEDGIISECLKRIGVRYNLVCEFGASDGFYLSNTAATGLPRVLFDINWESPVIPVIKAEVTPDNVNDLVPEELDLLSIDVDGNDYNIWMAYNGTANIVVIEINSSIVPGTSFYVSDPERGTDYISMVKLGRSKGYFLLCHCGNLIFILKKYRKLFPEIKGVDAIRDRDLFFNTSWL